MANNYIESNEVARPFRGSKRRGIQPDKLCVGLFLLDPEKNITRITRDTCCNKESERLRSLGYGAPPSDFLYKDNKVQFPFSMTTEEFKDKLVEIYPKLNNVEYLLMKADKSNKLERLNLHTSFYNPKEIYYSNLGRGKLYIRWLEEHSQTTNEGPLGKRPRNSTTSESQSSACPVYRMIRPRLATSQSTTVSTAPPIAASVSSTPTNIAPPEAGCTTLTSPSVCTSGMQLSIPTDQSGNVTTTSVPLSSSLQNNSNVGTSLTNSLVSQQPQQLLQLLQQLLQQQPQQLLQEQQHQQQQKPIQPQLLPYQQLQQQPQQLLQQQRQQQPQQLLQQQQQQQQQQPQQLLQQQQHQQQSRQLPQQHQQPQQLPQQQHHQQPLQPQLSYQQLLQQQTQHLPLQLRQSQPQEQQNHHQQQPLHQQQEQSGQSDMSCSSPLNALADATVEQGPMNQELTENEGFEEDASSSDMEETSTNSRSDEHDFLEKCEQTGHLEISPKVLKHSSVLERLQSSSMAILSVKISKYCKLDEVLEGFPLPLSLKALTIKKNCLDDSDMTTFAAKAIRQLKNLEEFDLSSTLLMSDFRCMLISGLANLTALKRLCLVNNCLGQRDTSFLAAALPSLINLEILKSKNYISDEDMQNIICTLAQLKHLKVLELSGNNLCETKAVLNGIASVRSIEKLDLSCNHGGKSSLDVQNAEKYEFLSSLKVLSLSSNSMIPNDFRFLGLILFLSTSLEELTLDFNHVGASIWALSSLTRAALSLKKLSLTNTEINGEGLSSFLTNLEKLEVLNLGSNNLSSNDFRHLQPCLSKLSNLRVLNLSDNPGGSSLSSVLKHILPFLKSLEELNVSNTHLDGTGLGTICSVIGSLKGLKRLDVSNNMIGSEGADALAKVLPSLQNLEELDVSKTRVCGNGMNAMCAAIESLVNLKSLSLSGNKLGSVAGTALASSMSSLHLLEELNLRATDLDDHCMKTLFHKCGWPNTFKKLILSKNTLEQSGASALAGNLLSMSSLEELNLGKCYINEECFEVITSSFSKLNHLEKLTLSELSSRSVDSLASVLSSLQSLEELYIVLYGMDLYDDDAKDLVAAIGSLKYLKRLHFRFSHTCSVGTAALASTLLSLQLLEELVLDNMCYDDDDDAKELCAAIGSLKYLKKLHFMCSYTCSVGVAALPSMLPSLQLLEELELVAIEHPNGGDIGKLFLAVGSLKHLKKLILCVNNKRSTGVAALVSMLSSLQLLEELQLREMYLCNEDDDEKLFLAMGSLKHLKKLNLSLTEIGSTGASALASVLPSLQFLEELKLGEMDLSDGGDDEKLFLAMGSLKYLKKLHFWRIKIGSTGVAVLASVLPSLQLLEELGLGEMDLTDGGDDEKLFLAMGSLKYLKKLHFWRIKIGSTGVAALASVLPSLQLLEELGLGEIDLIDGGDDEKLLRAMGSLKHLKKLHLWEIKIGSTGIAALASVLPSLQLLEKLQLDEIDLTDGGDDEKLFLAMGSLKYLKKLNLSTIKIGSTGAAALASVLPSLHALEQCVFNCELSSSDLIKLESAAGPRVRFW